jgi:mannose-6-phosphate isomerase-like protein (cupin superfamily)
VLVNPLHGERIRFLKTVPDTKGEFVQYESWLVPGGSVGVPHVHPLQESHFEVLSGRATFVVGGKRLELGPGEILSVPPRTPHNLWNAGSEEAHLIIEFRPGLLKQEFYEVVYGLARDGKHRGWHRNLLQRAVLTAAYHQESRPLNEPGILRLGLLLLAPAGHLLGYRAHYPHYCLRVDRPAAVPEPGPAG